MSDKEKKQELFQYVLVIKKEDGRSIDYISILICLMSWIFFMYDASRGIHLNRLLFFASFLVPATLAWTHWIRKSFQKKTGFKTALFATALVWILVPGLRWVSLLFILFILFDQQARVPLEVGISDEQIVINTFFRKRYLWIEFSNVILKDGLLTLDFKNNRILQREVLPLGKDEEEKEFNEFCRQQLILNKK
ncbi:MAG: hypothetical protein C5B52_15895 [Bacteroidetes bacterium]|nr:MAG: hypothetical protein C5B52_15895 [Bacteroidota bacterium]